MTEAQCGDNPVDDLAEEFARRWRNGERPSVEDYAARFSQWADDIRDMFPVVLMMEQLKPRREDQAGSAAPSLDPGRAPDRLGEYRIVREIGRGGMGVVYEAQQETLGRRVAIKVLPAHLFPNEKLRSRFRRESQAAARLHHTNIVPVFSAGEQDGLCFYVMQLIAGRGLDAALSTAARGPGTAPPAVGDTTFVTPAESRAGGRGTNAAPRFTPRAAARIGVQVADALAYAHGQGVLHRDVKPSNLLLDERGTVWVTDFGVAKLVEEANLTQSGDLVGTLRYMPPERFQGQSDARGDVYSLGITLYEMLAGRPAFPDTTPHHLIQLITAAEPSPLRQLNPSVPTDLETVILKAVARDPGHRYATAGDLSDDLRRFLDDRPILARRTSAAGQAWRWCRRNRVVAALAVAVFSLLVVTSVVAVTAYVRTSAANRETATKNDALTDALGAEQAQRERAEKTSASALEAMNRIYDRFAPNRIVVTPGLPAENAAEDGPEIPPQPLLSPEAVPLLEDLLGFYEQLAREGSDNPNMRPQAAEAEQRIGDIRQRLGQLDPAIAAYRKAVELYDRTARGPQDDAVRIKVARTYNELGRALRNLQRTDEARDAHARALATLGGAPPDAAVRPEYRYELARTYYFQARRETIEGPPEPPPGRGRGPDGFGRGRPGGPDEPGRGPPPFQGRGGPPPSGPGEPPRQRAIRLLEELVKEHRSVPEYRHLLACCYRDGPPRRPGHGAPADAASDPAVDLLRQLVKEFPRVPDYRYDLCETLARVGFPGGPLPPEATPAAKAQLEAAVTLSRGLVQEYPNVPLYAAAHASVHDRLGVLLHQARQLDDAEKTLRKAVSLQSALVRQHPEVVAYDFSLAQMQASLARVLVERDNLKEAKALLEVATGRLGAILTKDPRLGSARSSLGRALRDFAQVLGRLGEADRAAVALRTAEGLGPDRGPGPFGPHERPQH